MRVDRPRFSARLGLWFCAVIVILPLGAALLFRIVSLFPGYTVPYLESIADLLLPSVFSLPGIIWSISLVFLLVGLATALRDVQRLGREWRAADVLWTSSQNTSLASFPILSRTVLALRQRAIQDARATRAVFRLRERLSQEAFLLLAGVGGATRFIAGALLLLAVLGTFAGIRGSMPALTDALASTVQDDQFGSALRSIGGAFGANFIALLGSLALGIAAHSAINERRHLLLAIESVAEARLYPDLPEAADASSLERAVLELELGVRAVNEVGAKIAGLSAVVDDFTRTTNRALDEIHQDFSQHAKRLQEDVQRQLEQALAASSKDLQGATASLKDAAAAFVQLSTGIKDRDTALTAASEAVAEAAARSREDLGTLSASLAQGWERLEAAASAFEKSGRSVAERFAQLQATTTAAAERLELAAAQQRGAVEAVAAGFASLRVGQESVAGQTSRLHDAIREQFQSLVSTLTNDRSQQGAILRDAAERLAGVAREQSSDMNEILGLVRASAESTRGLESLVRPLDASAHRLGGNLELLDKRMESLAGQIRSLVDALERVNARGRRSFWPFWK